MIPGGTPETRLRLCIWRNHPHPGKEVRMPYVKGFEEGQTFEGFLLSAEANRELWYAVTARVSLPEEARRAVQSIPDTRRLLVIADDWCGDAVNMLPVIAALAGASENVSLRIIGRDAYPSIMDRHLTRGARSIPVVILLGEDGGCLGWWGPRPIMLQEWFEHEGRGMAADARYRELRRWYARDRGASIASEVAALLCSVPESPRVTRPCTGARAA